MEIIHAAHIKHDLGTTQVACVTHRNMFLVPFDIGQSGFLLLFMFSLSWSYII